MRWVVYLNFLCPWRYLCWLKSQLSFISLLSFEMLSDCVISGLYMRILKLTWEKIDFCEFSLVFWCFNVERPNGYSCPPNGWSLVVRTGSVYIRTHAAINDRSIRITLPDAHDLSAWFRGSARPDGVNTPSGRGPHRGYIYPWSPPIHSTPPKSHFLASCEGIFASFWDWLAAFCLFVHFHTFLVFLLALFSSV
jgi:hypothetical protein